MTTPIEPLSLRNALAMKNPKTCNYSSDEIEWRKDLLALIENVHDRLHAKPEINKLREKYLL